MAEEAEESPKQAEGQSRVDFLESQRAYYKGK
jgi:hypothetical protein